MIKNAFLISIAAALLVGCTTAPGAAPGNKSKVRLPMGYIASVQYAPFYVAVDKGYFASEGIELEFDYKFETDGVKLVGAGELPFAVVSGEQVVLARAQGVPVKYVMQWFKKFPVAIISLQKTGITTPQDLKGKRVGLPGFFGATYVGWRAFLKANNLTEQDVIQQEIGFTQIAALQSDKADAVIGYINNEPIVLAKNGFPVRIFAVSDAVDMVANGLLTSEKVIKENPKLVRGMINALLKGVADTISNPDAAMQITTKYVEGFKADDPIQKDVLLQTIELMKGGRPGESTAQAWENTQDALITTGQLQKKLDTSTLYTNEFLP